jgi:putative SOS response-associated peptidase YedK
MLHASCFKWFFRFYEWKKDGSKKQPYYIHFKDGRPLVFAALYDSWQNSEGECYFHTSSRHDLLKKLAP